MKKYWRTARPAGQAQFLCERRSRRLVPHSTFVSFSHHRLFLYHRSFIMYKAGGGSSTSGLLATRPPSSVSQGALDPYLSKPGHASTISDKVRLSISSYEVIVDLNIPSFLSRPIQTPGAPTSTSPTRSQTTSSTIPRSGAARLSITLPSL